MIASLEEFKLLDGLELDAFTLDEFKGRTPG
jgi:hypothetical protein